jgi:hypothetical protein
MHKKDVYIQKLHAKIDEWNADIDKLAAKANQLEADSKIELQKQIENVKRKRNEIKRKIAESSNAGEDAWKDLKAGIDLAYEAMNEAVKSAASRFK